MGAFGVSRLAIGAGLSLALIAVPAAAGLPGSTQPGAQPASLGNLIIIRVVPPRNAIIPGAGAAVTAPTAAPSIVFAAVQGVGAPLSDSQAASVTGSIAPGQSGQAVAAAIDGVLGTRSMAGGPSPIREGASGFSAEIGGAVHSGVGALAGVLGNLGGLGH